MQRLIFYKQTLKAAAVPVDPVIRAILQESVGEIAVGVVQLYTVKPGCLRALGSPAERLDQPRDFLDPERAVRRHRHPSVSGEGLALERHDGGRDRCSTVAEIDMRLPAVMPRSA